MCLKQYFKSIKIFLITNINGQAVQQFGVAAKLEGTVTKCRMSNKSWSL